MLLRVGRVIRAHGLRGEVSVTATTDQPASRFAPGEVLRTRSRAWPVVSSRPMGDRWLVRLDGVEDRDRAEELRGEWLWAEVTVKALDGGDGGGGGGATAGQLDEVHDVVLVGMAVRTTVGKPVGRVSAVEHYPAQDILTVQAEGGSSVMIPFVAAIVVNIDIAAGIIEVDPPVGLLSPDQAT